MVAFCIASTVSLSSIQTEHTILETGYFTETKCSMYNFKILYLACYIRCETVLPHLPGHVQMLGFSMRVAEGQETWNNALRFVNFIITYIMKFQSGLLWSLQLTSSIGMTMAALSIPSLPSSPFPDIQ